ncbi:MAG: DUF5937 family protein [Gaiellales bacterium]
MPYHLRRQLISEGVDRIAIRFHVEEGEETEALAFAVSPLLEALVSLHVLADPRHHPLQHRWVREARTLRPELRREIRAWRFAVGRIWPAFLFPEPAGPELEPEDDFARLEALDDWSVATSLLRPLVSDGPLGPHDPSWREEPWAGERPALVAARYYGPECAEVAHKLLADPAAGVSRFRKLVRRYWDEAFAAEWECVRPVVDSAIEAAGVAVARDGLIGYLDRFSRRLRIDRDEGAFGLDTPHEHRLSFGPERRLVVIPSVYAWPHVAVNCDEPWPAALVVPVPPRDATGPVADPGDTLQVLEAVADRTRLRLLRLVLDQPRSTQELAPLVGLTEQGVSRQLRKLATAGLVSSRREGYYVLYAADRRRLAGIQDALDAFLATPSPPPERPPRDTGPAATTARGRRARRT